MLLLDNDRNHDTVIKSRRGLNAVLMGIGEDGGFCGSLPQITSFADETVEASISIFFPKIKEILAQEIGDASKVPDSYITMGPKNRMKAKEIYFNCQLYKKRKHY